MTQEQINALLKKKAGTTEVIKEEKVMVAAEEVKETINEDVIKEETSMMAEETKVAVSEEVVAEVKVEAPVAVEVPAEEPVEAPETAEEVSDNEEAVEGAGKPESDMENIISTLGIEMIDKNTAAVATDSLYGNRLHIRAFISRETNRRKYLIFEVDKAGQELGTTGCDSLFKASEVSNGSSKIKHLLQELDGQYAGQIADILKRIAIIEKRRLLVTVDTLDIDSCRTFEELWVMLQNWFESHLDDKRVGVVDIKGRTHVVLVKRGRQGLNEVFQSVIKEIAPNLKANWVKGELYRRELIYHDANDICKDKQLTVSLFVRAELGISNDKVMSFAFDEEVIEHMKEGYEILHCDYEEEE